MKDNYCRICLKSTRFLRSIIEPQTSFCVLTFINKLCNVSILENEEFSNKICKSCLDKLTIAHNIRSTCIASDNKLRQQIIPTKTSSDPSTNIKTEIQEEILEIKSLHNNIETFNNEESTVFSKGEANDKNESESPLHGFKSKISRDKSSEKSHMCSICGKTFFTLSHLRSHELIHKNTKDFTCHSCGKEFLKKSYLNRHIKSHLNERNYKCKICDKGFNTSTTLGYHFRLVHSGDQTFRCSFCGKGFPLKIQLISHTRTHTGEKPHKCDQCDKKYSHKIDLKRHMMLHTGNKAYKCPYCDRTFTKKSNMECHIPTHTGEKPYKCNICFKDFRQPCPYRKHMQTHVELVE